MIAPTWPRVKPLDIGLSPRGHTRRAVWPVDASGEDRVSDIPRAE